MNSSRVFHLTLFGSPTIAGEDGVVVEGRAAHRHRLALLSLLALAGGRGSSRDWLMGHLWPESNSERARNLLSVSVYVLRKELGDDAVLSEGDDLRLNPGVIQTDVSEFQAALERGDRERAVALSKVPLLEGFSIPNAPEFDRQLDRHREMFAAAAGKALESLAESAEAGGDYDAAVGWWRARAGRDPYDTRVALRLMEALEASGNRAGALRHAGIHEHLLRAEFGAEPPPEVRALTERLRGDPPVRATSPSRPPVDLLPDPTALGPAILPGPSSPALPPAIPAGRPERRRMGVAVRFGGIVIALGAVLFGSSLWLPDRSTPPASTPPEQSIAVFPLASLGADPGDAVLAAAMTEELTGALAKAGGIRVMGRTSVATLLDRRVDVGSIADSLGVANILEGGVQRIGSRLRVQVRLVDASDGSTRWSETYDRELLDVFAVQDDIAQAVTRALGVRLGQAMGAPVRRQPTQSLAAYEFYLRGSDRTLLRSDSAAREGVEYFRQAIALDPAYAAAWSGLARMSTRVASGAAMPDRARFLALADQAGQRAVVLDDSLAEAHATLGLHRMTAFDFGPAERHLMRAVELDPADARIHEWLVTLHLWTGRPAEALAHARRALQLDPLSPYAHAEHARALLGNDRCDEALAELAKLEDLDPPLLRVAPMVAQCYARKEMWPEAIAKLRPETERGGPTTLAQLGFLLARTGQSAEALRVHAALLEHWRTGGGAFPVAVVYVGLRDLDQAFAWFDRAVTDHSLDGSPGDPAQLMILGPLFDELRRDPRFERLRERMRLPARTATRAGA